jgi:hypothetical protein
MFKPLPGDVVCVDRGLYKHYGIYVNDNRIINFAPKDGFEINPKEACIQETDLEGFLKGGILEVDTSLPIKYSPEQTVRRAESCIGTNSGKYNLVFHNCEHFAHWCKSGVSTSHQVRNAVKGVAAAVAVAAVAAAVASSISCNSEKEDS